MEASTNLHKRGHNVKKVVDYRLDNGKRFYKVKWESSWESEDNLLKFQNLVDQFWGFVNRVKSEDDRYPMNKRPKLMVDHEKENTDTRYVEYTDHISSEAASIRDDGSTPTYQKQIYEENIEQKNVDSIRLKVLADVSQENTPSMLNSPLESREGIGDPKATATEETENAENNDKDYADDVGLTKTDFFNPLKKASRSNEKIFFCQLCSRGFTRRDMCIRHERVHTKDFCYFCAICEQGFMRRYVLIKHLKRIHNSDDVTHVLTTKKQRRDGVRNYKTPLSNREQVQPNRDIQFAANPQSSSDLSSTNTNIAVTKFDNASVTGKSIYTKVTLEERIPIVDPEVSNSSPNKILPCKVHELSKEANASHQSYQNILMSGSASILSHQNPSPCAIIKEELAIDISDPNQEITHGNQSCSDKPHLKIDEEANTENFNNRLIIGVSTEDNNQRTNVEVNKEIGQLDIGGNVIELDRNTLEQIKLGNFQVTREEEGNDLRTILIEKPESEEADAVRATFVTRDGQVVYEEMASESMESDVGSSTMRFT